MINLGATSAAGAGISTGVSPYVNRINTALQRAKAANVRVSNTPMDSRTRANYVETYRDIVSFGNELNVRAASGDASPDFADAYAQYISLVNDFVKAANSQQPAAPPAAPRVTTTTAAPLDVPAEPAAPNWWLWGGLGAAALGGVVFFGYKRGWYGKRRRR